MHFFVTAKLFLIFLQKSKKYRHKFTTLFPNILFYILFCLQREMLLFCMQAGARIVAVSVFVFVFVSVTVFVTVSVTVTVTVTVSVLVSVLVFVSMFVSVEESFPQDTMLCFLLFAGIIFNTRATSMRGVGRVWKWGVEFLWFNGLDCHNFVWVSFLIPVQQVCAVLGGSLERVVLWFNG